MPNWLIEEGIGETRAICIDGEEIIAARADWHETVSAGAILTVTLTHKSAGSKRGTARTACGVDILVSRLPLALTQGAQFLVAITRAAIAERTRVKLAQGRFCDEIGNGQPRPAPTLLERLEAEGHEVKTVRKFASLDWPDVIAEAFSGEIAFSGGSLQITPTAAMTLIDVDGEGSPHTLAMAAIPAIAAALGRLEISGNVGIDFPSVQDKAQRRDVDKAIGDALGSTANHWPHERTAMNGFGFVQLVARMERPSLLHRAAFAPAETAARLLLRRAEHIEGAGQIELRGHPAIESKLRPEWMEELARRTGRKLCFVADPALAIEAPQAQSITL